jgi:acyl-CoA thioester hydrolase
MTSTEQVISAVPCVIRRRVKFGECDPAGVVYTVVFAEYVISAAELFYGSLLGGPPQRAKAQLGFGTPSRAMDFDFRSSLRPDDEFEMTVSVLEIRSRTYVLGISARTPDGEAVFEARLTPVCVGPHERKAIEIPQGFRRVLEQYRADAGGPELDRIST